MAGEIHAWFLGDMPFHDPTSYSEMGFTVSFVIPTAVTKGRYSMIDYAMPPGFGGPCLHHHSTAESIYVLDGAIGVHLDGNERVLTRGEAAHIAEYEPHSFWNAGTGSARCLFIGDRRLEEMLAEIGTKAAAGDLTPQNVSDIVTTIEGRHGVVPLGPPPSACHTPQA